MSAAKGADPELVERLAKLNPDQMAELMDAALERRVTAGAHRTLYEHPGEHAPEPTGGWLVEHVSGGHVNRVEWYGTLRAARSALARAALGACEWSDKYYTGESGAEIFPSGRRDR